MSLKDAVQSYGSAMQGLRKKNKWGYMLEGAGSAMVEVGKSLSAFADITASTKLGHDQFQKGFEELGISEFQGIGTTYDTVAELGGDKDAQSTWSSFKESLRERLTTADKMKSSRGDGLFTVGEGVDERAYTAEEVRQVGMLYGDSAKSRLALAEYKLGEGEKGYVEPNKLFGISLYDKSTEELTTDVTEVNQEVTVKNKIVEYDSDPIKVPATNSEQVQKLAVGVFQDLSKEAKSSLEQDFKKYGEGGPPKPSTGNFSTTDKLFAKQLEKYANKLGMNVGGAYDTLYQQWYNNPNWTYDDQGNRTY